ncbi:hypothetical protein C8K18_101809 [Paraburkholderia sp. GV068]|uniref:hypothetical protein n=1 Tax=unclassified Paraburkholderia TaxID=2615204 RepID=UPI000D30FCD0|nr:MULTISPECIES: hypothetical protein [unclassified Paraburkholderia]PTR04328.1 hypothetical protein C8K19_101734 [Paraburkholderia sp. GV072]PUB09285.1 hypothetical protein C8K18_101809 [Paraburkholderia sp. GV068]
MQTTAAVSQQVTLYFPLSRLDGKPDNTPLTIAAELAARGFAFTSGEVFEVSHGHGIERTLALTGTTPPGSRSVWMPRLASAMRKLCTYCIDIDEDDTAELTAKLDGTVLTN